MRSLRKPSSSIVSKWRRNSTDLLLKATSLSRIVSGIKDIKMPASDASSATRQSTRTRGTSSSARWRSRNPTATRSCTASSIPSGCGPPRTQIRSRRSASTLRVPSASRSSSRAATNGSCSSRARRPESVRYVLLDARARDSERKVRVAEFLQGDEEPDAWEYIRLLCRSGQTLLAPFGYTEEKLARMCEDLSDISIANIPEQAITIQEDYKSIGESRSRARGGVGYKKPWRLVDEEEMPSEITGDL